MKWLLAAVALLLFVPPAVAQMEFSQPYQVRIGLGDLSTTAAQEPEGWSVEQRYTFTHADGQDEVMLDVPPGSRVVAATCTCGNVTTSLTASTVSVHLPPEATPGTATVTLTTTTPRTVNFGFQTAARVPGIAIIYVPSGSHLESSSAPTQTLSSTDGRSTITTVEMPAGSVTWLAVVPGVAGAGVAPAATTNPWLYAAAGLLVGMALWAFLVSRGAVQRRSRKQVATTAAHVEAAKGEPVPVLEGRKRALMAALKEIELARQADELDVPTYDTLKAELKKEAVTVMRAIDEAKGQKS